MRIIGTRWADQIEGTDEVDLIRGRGGDDALFGNIGDDRIYGDAGNDFIVDDSGWNQLRGGAGDDWITSQRGIAYGGVGNDSVNVGGGGWAIGGKGDDTVSGTGYLCGDEGPGIPEQIAGADRLILVADLDGSRAHGGLGNDLFGVVTDPFVPVTAVIDDFRPGEDKIKITADVGHDEPVNVLEELDFNRDGFLNHADTVLGAEVWIVPLANAIALDYGAGRTVVYGTLELTPGDWLL